MIILIICVTASSIPCVALTCRPAGRLHPNAVLLMVSSYKHMIYICNSMVMFYTIDRPYLWGSAGSSHYSIKSNLTLTLSTQPSVDSVIECLDRDLLHKSAYNLPLHRQLSPDVSHDQ